MDCVGCDKCKLWGKLQVTGLGTALKVSSKLGNILAGNSNCFSIDPLLGGQHDQEGRPISGEDGRHRGGAADAAAAEGRAARLRVQVGCCNSVQGDNLEW